MIKLITLPILLFLSACSEIAYYHQSIQGHFTLMNARQPIDELIETSDEALSTRLKTTQEIRTFGIKQLGLPDNNSYTSYVELGRDFPVWNVVASEPLSITPKQWCYLVIGCASYRGFYDKADAEAYALKLQNEGYDVTVTAASAYSTLGWFSDPILSSMLRRGDASLAELIFHELAHQKLYVKGDSRFNEAFASTVGEQGAIVWLKSTGQDNLLVRYRKQLAVYDDFLDLLNSTKASLVTMYSSSISDEEKRQQKRKLFENMKAEYRLLKNTQWNGHGWYDRWFERPLNNARLVAVATYRDLVPDFVELFDRCEQDFIRFYATVSAIAERDDKSLNSRCLSEAL